MYTTPAKHLLAKIKLPTLMTLADGSKVDSVNYYSDGTIGGQRPDESQAKVMLRGVYEREEDIETHLAKVDAVRLALNAELETLAGVKAMLKTL